MFHDVLKVYKTEISLSVNKVYWDIAILIHLRLSMAVFTV